MSYHDLRGLGEAGCPPCTFLFSGECMPCPEGSDFPECEGCVGGKLQQEATQDEPAPPAPAPPAAKGAWTDTFWGMVTLGVVTTLTVTVATTWLSRRMKV